MVIANYYAFLFVKIFNIRIHEFSLEMKNLSFHYFIINFSKQIIR